MESRKGGCRGRSRKAAHAVRAPHDAAALPPSADPPARMTRPLSVLTAVILCVGTALQALLWSRQRIGADQSNVLLTGIKVLAGDLPLVVQTTSGGGHVPGALVSLLVAGPLAIWPDYRAPGLLIGLSHLAAAVLLWICIGRALGARFATAWLAVYWLSPWRLVYGGLVWEPCLVFLPAALHLASAYRLRERPHQGWSLLHAATLTAGMQLYFSHFVLLVLTALLAAARRVHLHVRGAFLGALAGGLTLIPTALALIAGTLPQIVPAATGELPRVLVGLMNLPKSLAYWFLLGSPHMEWWLKYAAPPAETAFARSLTSAVTAATTVSVGLVLFASWHWFRRRPSRDPAAADRRADWLRANAVWCFAALCVAAAVSPVRWEATLADLAAIRPVGVITAATTASAALAALVSWLWFQRSPRESDDPDRRGSPAGWLRAYAGWCLVALCTAAVLSPIPLRSHHVPIALHAACLPVAAQMLRAFQLPSVLMRAAAVAFVLLQVAVVLLVAFGHSMYRPPSADTLEDRPPAVRALVPGGSW